MPVVIATLVGFFAQALSSVIARVLVGLGIGYIAKKGADVLLAHAQDAITAKLGALAGSLLQAVTIANIPQAVVILFGYYATKIAAEAASKITFGKKAT